MVHCRSPARWASQRFPKPGVIGTLCSKRPIARSIRRSATDVTAAPHPRRHRARRARPSPIHRPPETPIRLRLAPLRSVATDLRRTDGHVVAPDLARCFGGLEALVTDLERRGSRHCPRDHAPLLAVHIGGGGG